MTTDAPTLFPLAIAENHAHVPSKDWVKANLCVCGRYRCTELMAIDGAA